MKLTPIFKPIFKGYIVDDAAQRFRKITSHKGEPSTYIPFDSPKGRKMRKEFIALCKFALRKVDKQSKRGKTDPIVISGEVSPE